MTKNKNKKRMKAKMAVNGETKEQPKDENFAVIDTPNCSKSNSSIVSSIYLFSLTFIILALSVIIGLMSYIQTYNSAEKSAQRFAFRSDDSDDRVSFQEDIVLPEYDDVAFDDSVQPEPDDINEPPTMIFMSSEKDEPSSKSTPNKYLEHRELLKSYRFDFEKVQKLRQEAMKKYSFPYSTDGVDKRSNLSLEEFFDVYDGKW